MRKIDPLDIVDLIREGLLARDRELTVRLAHYFFGDAYAVTPKGTSRDKEGSQ